MTLLGRHKTGKDAGFTLVELLVVITVIGLMASVAVLSLPNRRPDTQEDVERLAARLQLAADMAVLSGRPTGVEFSRDKYRILVRRQGRWFIDEDSPEGGFPLPRDAQTSLVLEGEKMPFANSFSSTLNRGPTLLFLASGEVGLFTILVRAPDGERTIQSDPSGTIRFENVGDGA